MKRTLVIVASLCLATANAQSFSWLQNADTKENVGCKVDEVKIENVSHCETILKTLQGAAQQNGAVARESGGSIVAALVCAALGGAIGHQVGNGRGKAAATAALATIGGLACYKATEPSAHGNVHAMPAAPSGYRYAASPYDAVRAYQAQYGAGYADDASLTYAERRMSATERAHHQDAIAVHRQAQRDVWTDNMRFERCQRVYGPYSRQCQGY